MRNIFLLLAPLGAFSRSTPFYLADGLVDFSDQMIRGSNPVFVTQVGGDSMIISTSGSACEHASEYKRKPGEAFLRRPRGGNFGRDLHTYNKNDSYILAQGAGGSLRLEQGVAYEIDCN
jgi:hypothetical protein